MLDSNQGSVSREEEDDGCREAAPASAKEDVENSIFLQEEWNQS